MILDELGKERKKNLGNISPTQNLLATKLPLTHFNIHVETDLVTKTIG